MLIAAWKKNQLEMRLAWLSPTYTQWNPKLPWGTDYEKLTEDPPEVPSDVTNARLEPWRRWNWVTDGTPNKWLNVPYEYPWNMAAGQFSGLPLTYTVTNPSGDNPVTSSDSRISVATMDLAKWEPFAYSSRPAPPKEMIEGTSTYTFWTDKVIIGEPYEYTYVAPLICTWGFPGTPFYREARYNRTFTTTRLKNVDYDENGFPIWRQEVNPRTGLLEEIRGTLITWGKEITGNREWKYNPHQKVVFHDNRVAASVVRWNLELEEYEDNDLYEYDRYFIDISIETTPRTVYSCDIVGPNPVALRTEIVEGQTVTYTLKKYTVPAGMKDRWEVDYTDTFKFSSYQKKTPYPCYRKPTIPDNRRWIYVRNTNLYSPDESGGQWEARNIDARPEALGLGYPEDKEGVEFDDAPNTWYQRWRYKPSQHWADGWGIRNESGNFYENPEFRVGKIYQSAEDIGNAEKDPVTGNHNAWFWQGMHKELYPMFNPGTYVGDSPIGDGGMPNAPREAPEEGEDIWDYYERTDYYIDNYTTKWRYGNWFTMPVHHYSANDLYKTLCEQEDIEFNTLNPATIPQLLAKINVPGQPSLLTPPVLSTEQLDTTFIYNSLTLVPTDFVHSPFQPLPVSIRGFDANGQIAVSEPGMQLALYEAAFLADAVDDYWYYLQEVEWLTGVTLPVTDLYTTPLPTIRPAYATLANYPTGWELHPDHYKTHQARLIGETEMNHRCESIPNWLDTDGGLLVYYSDGPLLSNEGQQMRRTYFYFIRQARLPSYHDTHQGIRIKVEMLFRKRTQYNTYSETKRESLTSVEYDVERYEVELDFPDNQNLDPVFDTTYYQKDTDPGRAEKNPSKIPNRWKGPSNWPTYDIYGPDTKGDSEKNGIAQDKRDWQSFGPYSTTVTTVETAKVEGKSAGNGKLYSYVRNVPRYVPSTWEPTFPGEVRDPTNQTYWGHYENDAQEVTRTGTELDELTTTTLTLLDIKITDITGPVYRSYGSNRPAGSP